MKYNGNITLNTLGQSEIQNLVAERFSSTPAFFSSEAGRLIYNTTDRLFYMNSGLGWVSLSTGGNAAALQTEVDAIETSLGSAVTGSGAFNAAAFTGTNIVSAASITDAINQLDGAISGKNELSELLDVAFSSVTNGNFLRYDTVSGKWVNHALVLADVTNVTSTAAEVNQLSGSGVVTADLTKLHAVTASATELNKLTGATVTTTELNYVHGVTSALQTQLNNKQPLNAELTSISGLTPTTGDILVGKVDGSYELLTGAGFRSAEGLVIGTDIQAFDADLSQIAGFAPTAGSLAGNGTTEHDFIVATGTTEGSRYSLQRGATVRGSLGLGDIATHDDAEYVRVNGANAFTSNQPMGGFQLTGLGAPTLDANAATKLYVDSLVSGLTWKNAVSAMSSTNITLSGTQTIDGVALVAGNRVLVAGQTLPAQNGIYVVAAGAWMRSTDADTMAEVAGLAVFVEGGTTYADTAWTCTTPDTATLNTDPITFVQFNGASGITAGVGLAKTGNILSVVLGAGITQLPTSDVGIDIYSSTGAIILTMDGSTRSTNTDAQLHLLLDTASTGSLVQSSSGLKISANTVSETELTASVAGDGLVGGNGSPLAVASAAGTAGTVGTLVITANTVGVALGTTSTTAARGDHIHAASVVTFDNTTSSLAGSPANVQAAIDAVVVRIGTAQTTASTLQSEVDAIETGAGLNSDGTYTANGSANFISGATSLKDADNKLDAALNTLQGRVNSMYFLYSSSSAATSHSVAHNLGVKYCNVTVIDSATDEQIIPQSVTFDSTTGLTVTFNVAINCKVVVMGLA